MEKKPNIGLTKIKIRRIAPINRNVIIQIERENGEYLGELTGTDPEDEKAIVTAVNCTYGANLNPEKIQELIEALEPFSNLLNQFDGLHRQRPIEGIIHSWHHNKHGENHLSVEMLKKASEALNNIKYKDQ